MAVNRETVDLSKFPDLVVIYLGMRGANREASSDCSALAEPSERCQ
jgi:hypothetical protein